MVHRNVSMAVADSGLKHKHLADLLGVTEPVLSAMLSGNRKISADEFYSFCVALNIDPDTLFHYEKMREKYKETSS